MQETGAEDIPLAPPEESPELPATLSERYREGGVMGATEPYAEGVAQAIKGMIPTSQEQVQEFTKPPMGGIDLQTENELGAAWRGEYGPKAQAAALTGTALQALPFLHLPFAKTPLRPSPRDLALIKQIRESHSVVPPPIPDQLRKLFTAPGLESGWQMGPGGEHVPVGQPEVPPPVAPALPIEQTLQTAEQAAPVAPPVETQADVTRRVLANRTRITNRIEEIRPHVMAARQVIGPSGERALEAEWADLNAQLNDKATNPVVHAPPETAPLPGLRQEGFQPLPQEARFPRGGPAVEPGAPSEPVSEPGRVKTAEPSIEAAKYGGPAAAREALRQQVRRDQANRIKRKIQSEGGFVSKVTMEDIRNLGKEIYEWGMDFHQWAAEMLAHLGKQVAGHLQDIWKSIQATAPYRAWEEITGGRLRKPLDLSKPENFELVDRVVPLDITRPTERGSIGGGEVPGREVPPEVQALRDQLKTLRATEREYLTVSRGSRRMIKSEENRLAIQKVKQQLKESGFPDLTLAEKRKLRVGQPSAQTVFQRTPDGHFKVVVDGKPVGEILRSGGWGTGGRGYDGSVMIRGKTFRTSSTILADVKADIKDYVNKTQAEPDVIPVIPTGETRSLQIRPSLAERIRARQRGPESGAVGRTGLSGKEKFVSVDSNGERKIGEFDPNLKFVPKLLDTAPREEPNLFRTKNILGTGNDPKTVKGEKYGVTTYISYLSAAKGSGVADLCLFKTDECTAACLGKEGRGSMSNVKKGRIDKTKFFVYDPVTYLKQLDGEIVKAKAKAAKTGNELAIRLNGLSDVDWAKSGIMERHPDVQFYDYTKYPQTSRRNMPPNYHLTYSYTGLPGSEAFSKTWNDHGVNTAVVFANGMPAEFMGRPVIDGDVSDLRFLDPKGVIVGLHAKGAALKLVGQSKFIYDTPPEDVAIPYFDPRQKARIMKSEFLGEEAIDAMKDLAPKAGDLKWKRGNPDLGLNQPGATPELSPIQAFRERLKARREAIRAEGRQLSALGFDPEDTALQAAIGGTYIAEGVTDFAKWSAAMVKEFGPDIEPHLTNLWKSANAAHQQFQQSGQYTTQKQTPPTQDAPVGVRNETLRAREDAGLSTAPPPGRGVTWQDSVNRGNKALDDPVNPADPYKIISDFNKDHLIGHPRLDPVRAWLERLQRANSEAHGALEADPQNPALAAEALRTQALEDEFAAAYQPMKTEWSRSGTGMQEERGITDADLLSQKTAEQTMRDHMDRELNVSDKARAADAVKRTRKANADTEAAFTEALDHAEKAAKAPPMTPEQMKAHFAERIKQLTPC